MFKTFSGKKNKKFTSFITLKSGENGLFQFQKKFISLQIKKLGEFSFEIDPKRSCKLFAFIH